MPPLLCGIDIGGTKMATGLVAPDGAVVRMDATGDHVRLGEEALLDFAADRVRRLCREAGVEPGGLAGVAVGMAGHMRSRDGVVITTSNLAGFKNYPLAAELSRRLGGLRVILENDANCQAWAEYRGGAGRGHDDMVFITVSTGIGAGIIIGGRLYRGRSGTAGEIGHTIVQPDSDAVCTCGNRGCFMSHACTLNLEALAKKKSGRHTATRVFDNPGGARLDGRHIHRHADAGDPVAMEIIGEYADYLGIMLYNVFQIFNPSAIILGGGLMQWEHGFFDRMRDKFHTLARDMLHDPLTIAKASLGKDSGAIGAALLLLEDDQPGKGPGTGLRG